MRPYATAVALLLLVEWVRIVWDHDDNVRGEGREAKLGMYMGNN